MKSNSVSYDLPDHLISRYTPILPIRRKSNPLKAYKHGLRQGISQEAPSHFQIKNVKVLDRAQKDKQRLGSAYNPRSVYSSLKRNKVAYKPKFSPTDYQNNQAYDYHSIKASKALDLIAGKSPTLKNTNTFMLDYLKNLKQGFGKSRGDFTVEATQPKVQRHFQPQLATLRQIVRFKSTQRSRFSQYNQNLRETPVYSPPKTASRSRSKPNSSFIMKEIQDFEESFSQRCVGLRHREMYNL